MPRTERWSAPCSFTVTLVAGGKTIGKASGRLGPASSKRVVVKLSGSAKKRLKKAKKVNITIKFTAKDAAGNITRKSAKTTVKR